MDPVPLIALSYRRQDSEAITGRIFDRLAQAYGKDAVFRDIDSIPAGADFAAHINSVLRSCDLLIVVIGRRWLGRSRSNSTRKIDEELDFVRIEVETALQLELPVIPILVGNAQMLPAKDLPETIKPLAFRNAIKIDAGQDFENHIARLFRSIEGSIKTTGNRSASAIPETENPVIENVSAQTAKRSFARRITIFLITSAVVLTAAVGSYIYSRYPNISTLDLSSRRDTPAPLARPSEVEELLAGNDYYALAEYLRQSPGEPRKKEILDRQAALRRAEFHEWTLYGITLKPDILTYLKFSSIQKLADTKYVFERRFTLIPSIPINDEIKDPPEGSYGEGLDVHDCQSHHYWTAEVSYYEKSGKLLHHYKWSNPEFVADMVQANEIVSGSIADTVHRILCSDKLRIPLLGKNDLAKSTFTALSSTPKGDGELYYHKLPNDERGTTLLVAQLKTNKPVAEADTEAVKEAVGNNTTYKTMAQLIRFNCEANKFSTIKIEYYSEDRVMVRVLPFDVLKNPIWNDLVEKSPMELLRRISCSGD